MVGVSKMVAVLALFGAWLARVFGLMEAGVRNGMQWGFFLKCFKKNAKLKNRRHWCPFPFHYSRRMCPLDCVSVLC